MPNRAYSPTTIKVLFASSGNQCAYPDCKNPIVAGSTEQSDAAVVGQICHIFAASDDGPRGNSALTDAERNAPENLILMCGHHHPLVDKQWKDYPATLLIDWKAKHEATYQSGTAEAVRLQEKTQQLSYTAGLTDNDIEAKVLRLRQARQLSGFPLKDNALALAASIDRIELASGSNSVRARGLAWCARMLAMGDTIERARELIAKSIELGGSAETEIAKAFLTSQTDGSAALSALAAMNTPMARTAMLRIVTNERGPEKAVEWAKAAGLQLASFDSEGKLILIMNEETVGLWDEAYLHADEITPEDISETPVLSYAMAMAFLAHAVPDELRTPAIFQIPFDAATIPLADDDDGVRVRRRAIEAFERQAEFAQLVDAKEAATLSADTALWLRLRDPELHPAAMEELRQSMRDDVHSLRRLPLAINFGLRLDLDAMERRVNERVALTGKGTHEEAIARFALAFTKPTASEAVEYISLHRAQLYEFLERPTLISIEIELLCRAGQVDTAKATLDQATEAEIDERQRDRIKRIIAEAEGADPAAERRRLYEATGELRDLMNLVIFLEDQEAWQDLVPLAEEVFRQTRSIDDALRTAKVMLNAGEHQRLLKFLQANEEIVAQADDLKSALAWALYRDGRFKAALAVLEPLRASRDNRGDRALFVNLAIASGQWDSLVAFTTGEWERREERKPVELLKAGQLAQAVGAPHARDLITAATERAPEDPHVLTAAYFHATSGGWEHTPSVSAWLLKAAENSGDDGPLKSFSLKELLDLKPDWDQHQERAYKLLNAGEVTISGAAQALNQSLIHYCLLRPLANLSETDPRRRSLVYAYSGARPWIVKFDAKRLALDLTAIFTLARLDLLERAMGHYERLLIPDRTLVWLFQEREKASFHQPSRLKEAHTLKRLIAARSLKIFERNKQRSSSLAREVGVDLAAMLEAASRSERPAYAIRPAPVHRVGSVMEEEADLSAYHPQLRSCHAVVEALRMKGLLTASEEQQALSYLKLHEMRWPNENPIQDGADLYLDDLATTYLQTVGVLDKLKGAGFTAYIAASADEQDNHLIEFESFGEQQLVMIEKMRQILSAGMADGRIETISSGEQDSKFAQLQAQLNFLTTDNAVDAFVVDDRFVNRHLHMMRCDIQTPIVTSLDLIADLVSAGAMAADSLREHRTNLRRAGYTFVPVDEEELLFHLLQAPIVDGQFKETAELRAIRESVQRLRMSKVLQVPHELPWLQQYTLALIHAVPRVWQIKAEPKEAEAVCEWLLGQLEVRGWASVAEKGAEAKFAINALASVLGALSSDPELTIGRENYAYHAWIDDRLLRGIRETEPEIFKQIVALASASLRQAIGGGSEAVA